MRAGKYAEIINGASFGSPYFSMAPDSVLKTVVTAAPHRSTSIPFKTCAKQNSILILKRATPLSEEL